MNMRYAVAVLIILLVGCSASHSANPTSVLQGTQGLTLRSVAEPFTDGPSPQNLSGKNVSYTYAYPGGHVSANLVKGADGSIWSTDNASEVVRTTQAGTMITYAFPGDFTASNPELANGPGKTLWIPVRHATGFGLAKLSLMTYQYTIYSIPNSGDNLLDLAMGIDKDMYIADAANNVLYKMTPRGAVTTISLPSPNSVPSAVALGADGNMWFTENNQSNPKVGKITPQGIITEFTGGHAAAGRDFLIQAADGNIYHVGTNFVDQIPQNGPIIPHSCTIAPVGVTLGPDKQLWIAEQDPNNAVIAQFNVATQQCSVPYPIVSNAVSNGIAVGADGDIWFGYNSSAGDFIGVYEEKVTTIGIRLHGELSFTDPNYGFELGYAVGTTSNQTQTISLGMGESVQFENVDTEPHSAAFLGNATINNAPWPTLFNGSTVQSPAGTPIYTVGWATGSLNPNTTSPIYETGSPGFYMIGCQYHYNTNEMRTVVIVH